MSTLREGPVTAEEILRLIESINARVVPTANPCPSREEWEKIRDYIKRSR